MDMSFDGTPQKRPAPDRSAHAVLVLKAAAWLRRKGCVVFSEFATLGQEIPDGLGLASNGLTVLIECKANRADFLRDGKKFQRRTGLGLGNFRYYMGPVKIIRPEDLPPAWGLLEVHGRRIIEVVKAKLQPQDNDADNRDKRLLFSVLRRLDKEGLLTPILDMQTARLRNEKALMDLENMQNDLRRRKADLAWQLKALEVLEREQEAREKKALEKKNGQVVYG